MLDDARNKANEHENMPDKIAEEKTPDYMIMIAMLFGLAGMMLRMKMMSWFALFFCLSAYFNHRKTEGDLKQLVTTSLFIVMGLFMNYFGLFFVTHNLKNKRTKTLMMKNIFFYTLLNRACTNTLSMFNCCLVFVSVR